MLIRLTGLTLAGLFGVMALAPDGSDEMVSRAQAVPVDLSGGKTDDRRSVWLSVMSGEPAAKPVDRLSDREAIELALARGAEAAAPRDNARPDPHQGEQARIQTRIETATPPQPSPARAEWVVTGTVVNLRSGPGTSHAVVGQVRMGDVLTPIDHGGSDWVRIRTSQGDEAWIFSRYVGPDQG